MAHYIQTTRGYVNLDTALSIAVMRRRLADNQWATIFIVKDGVGVDHEIAYEHVLSRCVEVIERIPAAPGWWACTVVYCEREFFSHRYPIIGWEISEGGYPMPIALGMEDSNREQDGPYSAFNAITFVEWPDGRFCEVGFEGAICASVEECQTLVRLKAEEKTVRGGSDAPAAGFADAGDCENDA